MLPESGAVVFVAWGERKERPITELRRETKEGKGCVVV